MAIMQNTGIRKKTTLISFHPQTTSTTLVFSCGFFSPSATMARSWGNIRYIFVLEMVCLWLSLFVPKTYTPFFHMKSIHTKKVSFAFVMA